MQDHEARASDLNRKLIFSFFFAIFLIKATETKQTRAKIYCSTVTSDIKTFSLKLKLLKHRHFLTSVWLWFQISSISFGKIFWYAQTG